MKHHSFFVLAISLLLAGCGPSPPKALDDQTLDTLSRGRKYYPSLVISQAGKDQKYLLSDESTNEILQALLPIKFTTEVGLVFPPKAAHYQLTYGGKNPVEYQIAIDDDHLMFSERTFSYNGGNVAKFKAVIDKIVGGEGKPVP